MTSGGEVIRRWVPAGRHPTVIRILNLNSAERSDADHTPLFAVQDLPAVFFNCCEAYAAKRRSMSKDCQLTDCSFLTRFQMYSRDRGEHESLLENQKVDDASQSAKFSRSLASGKFRRIRNDKRPGIPRYATSELPEPGRLPRNNHPFCRGMT